MEKSLTALKRHCAGRLICVFGCGGNRDALYAVDQLREGDVLLIAGKGGENYQEIMGVKHIYNDITAVRGILAAKLTENERRDEK